MKWNLLSEFTHLNDSYYQIKHHKCSRESLFMIHKIIGIVMRDEQEK